MKIYTSQQMREIDSEAAGCGIDGLILMEHAAAALKDEVLCALGQEREGVVVVCGKGNNGGDGFAAARLLDVCCDVCIAFFDDETRLSGDAAKNYTIAKGLGIRIICDINEFEEALGKCGVVVDALYGFGFHGALSERDLEIVNMINRLGKYVIAADMPSGVCADTGECTSAVRAHKTVTFTGYKPAHLLFNAAGFCGETVVADIGIPKKVKEKYAAEETIEKDFVIKNLPRRERDAHKGMCGKVFIIGGSRGMSGAVCLAASAALRSGAGLVTLGVPRGINDIVQQKITEAMTLPLEEDERGVLSYAASDKITDFAQGYDTIVFGPGIGRSTAVEELLRAVLRLDKRVVIDADGLFALAGDTDMLKNKKAQVVITPHYAEMSRLTGDDTEKIKCSAICTAKSFAKEYGVTVVLKGAYTVVAGSGCYVNNLAGNEGMATAGSGDVLSGVAGALLCSAADCTVAAACAVYIHALAGDTALRSMGTDGMVSGDIVQALPEAFRLLRSRC